MQALPRLLVLVIMSSVPRRQAAVRVKEQQRKGLWASGTR